MKRLLMRTGYYISCLVWAVSLFNLGSFAGTPAPSTVSVWIWLAVFIAGILGITVFAKLSRDPAQ